LTVSRGLAAVAAGGCVHPPFGIVQVNAGGAAGSTSAPAVRSARTNDVEARRDPA
jgi:hypothetical protein